MLLYSEGGAEDGQNGGRERGGRGQKKKRQIAPVAKGIRDGRSAETYCGVTG